MIAGAQVIYLRLKKIVIFIWTLLPRFFKLRFHQPAKVISTTTKVHNLLEEEQENSNVCLYTRKWYIILTRSLFRKDIKRSKQNNKTILIDNVREQISPYHHLLHTSGAYLQSAWQSKNKIWSSIKFQIQELKRLKATSHAGVRKYKLTAQWSYTAKI